MPVVRATLQGLLPPLIRYGGDPVQRSGDRFAVMLAGDEITQRRYPLVRPTRGMERVGAWMRQPARAFVAAPGVGHV